MSHNISNSMNVSISNTKIKNKIIITEAMTYIKNFIDIIN